MSREPLSIHVGDVSALARSLRNRMAGLERVPSHVEMLNLLARSGGYRNFQHLKAERGSSRGEPVAELDHKRVRKAAGYFDLDSRLACWPKKYSLRVLCLWVIWARLPARTAMTELEFDERLILAHAFCDHAMLRRWLVDQGMVARTPDGGEYRRVEKRPPEEAVAVLRRLQ